MATEFEFKGNGKFQVYDKIKDEISLADYMKMVKAFFEHHFGSLPQLAMRDALRLAHDDDELIYLCRKKYAKREEATSILAEDVHHAAVNGDVFGTTDDDQAYFMLKDCQYMTFNSFKSPMGGKKQMNVARINSLLIEFDHKSMEEQALQWRQSDMPCTLKTYSGKKSIHVLVRFERDLNLAEWDELTVKTIAVFPEADAHVLADYSCLCRSPMAFRDNGVQQLVLAVGERVAVADYNAWLDRTLKDGPTADIKDLLAKRHRLRREKSVTTPKAKAAAKDLVDSFLSEASPVLTGTASETSEPQESDGTIVSPDTASCGENSLPPVSCNTTLLELMEGWWKRHETETSRPRTYRIQGAMFYALASGWEPKDVLSATQCMAVFAPWRREHPDKNIRENLEEVLAHWLLEKRAREIVKTAIGEDLRETNIVTRIKADGEAYAYLNCDDNGVRAFIRSQQGFHHHQRAIAQTPIRRINYDGNPCKRRI